MTIEQIEAIKLLELIEENTKQLKEFAYNKDYEDKKDLEDLEEQIFNIYYSLEDYMDIKNKIENAEEEYTNIPYYFTNHHDFKNSIQRLKESKKAFEKNDKLFEYLKENLDKDICYLSRTKLNRNDINNYAKINISVNYPKSKNTSTNCVHITTFNSLIRCGKSDQPIMQKLKCYDYPKPKEYYDVTNKDGRTKEFGDDTDNYSQILEFCNNALYEARELLKDIVR